MPELNFEKLIRGNKLMITSGSWNFRVKKEERKSLEC